MLYDWVYKTPPLKEGIICGGDCLVEWLLPWWLHNLRQRSSLPLVFFDFGLSDRGKSWSKAHNLELIPIDIPGDALAKRFLNSERTPQREAWFKKPFAMLATPFQKTLWLDIDCEVVKDIQPLFEFDMGLAPAAQHIVKSKKERGLIKEDDYNAGVIPFRHGAPLIQAFAKATLEAEGYFPGDQEILSHVIAEGKFSFELLPRIYNWQIPDWGTNRGAVIQHWKGPRAKKFLLEKVISKQSIFRELL